MSASNLFRAFGHVAATVDRKLYLWGGLRADTPKHHDSPAKTKFTSVVNVLDIEVTSLHAGNIWRTLATYKMWIEVNNYL